jgi:hypothetical protein
MSVVARGFGIGTGPVSTGPLKISQMQAAAAHRSIPDSSYAAAYSQQRIFFRVNRKLDRNCGKTTHSKGLVRLQQGLASRPDVDSA